MHVARSDGEDHFIRGEIVDVYGFFVELNNYLGFKFVSSNVVAGECGGLYYELCFISYGSLKVHTEPRLFGDDPYRPHIEDAFGKLRFFKSYTLVNGNVELFVDVTDVTEDTAFSIMEDLTSFSETLSALGYKCTVPQSPVFEPQKSEPVTQYDQMSYQQTDDSGEDSRALPRRIPLGILGALLGMAGGLLIWVTLSLTNYMVAFVLGIVIAVMLPIILYEVFSREKTSAVEIGICLFVTLLLIFLGDRLIWTFDLLRWYEDITFSQAYYEVPYMVEDEIVEAFSYYEDYIIALAALILFYFIVIRNYLKGLPSVLATVKAMNRR